MPDQAFCLWTFPWRCFAFAPWYYCGYDVDDLVKEKETDIRFGFEETVYLLLTGELPTKSDLKAFSQLLAKKRTLPDEVKQMILSRPPHDDQMGALHTIVSAMHLFDNNANSTDMNEVTRQCIDLIAKFPTIIAYNYIAATLGKRSISKLKDPAPNVSTAENFLYLLSGKMPEKATRRAF